MSPLPGGAADKAGNDYEELWTALRIADLLNGEATRIRLEPPGDDGLGIEFELDSANETWAEQAKHSAATWTVKRLRNDGVLAAAKHQVDRGRRFRLVTSSAATAMEQLADRARIADTIDAFHPLLTAGLKPHFDDVRSCWGGTDEDTWTLLKSIVVEHHPVAPLRRNVRLAFQVLYAGDPDLVISAVRGFCGDHLHEHVTAPQVATYLADKGFQERLLAGDENSRRLLHRTLERQQRRVRSSAPGFGFVPRSEVQTIIDDLLDAERPSLVVVDAPAGYGKSTVVSEVASELEKQGWFVAVARMDTGIATPTSGHLGDQMGLPDSPSVLLEGLAGGAPGLLVVDQLDAVSLFSGRMPDSFDAVEEVLEEIGRIRNLKALVVVRSVDLANDQRLRGLVRSETSASRHTLARLATDEVRRHLEGNGFGVPSEDTLDFLRVPLHLAVYSLLSDDARSLPHRTLQGLYDHLTPEIRRRAESRAGHLDWQSITSFLVSAMSEMETLTLPRAALDSFSVDEIAALESEGLLIGDDPGIAFFHESYFDYLFARSFVQSGKDLRSFLAEAGQFLFRRAQTRQVLEYLGGTDRQRFRETCARLLAAPDIRSHLKHVTVGVLRQIAPEPEDWVALDDIAWSDEAIGSHLLALLSQPSWFDAADRLGRWEVWLEDAERVDRAANQLVFAARRRGARVAELVEPHVGTSDEWRLRLRSLISWSLSPELVPLTVTLIEGGYVDDARGPIAVNSDFWSIVHSLVEGDPSGAALVAGAFLRRGLARAVIDGSDDPFETNHLSSHSASGSVISDIAAKAPAAFVDEVLPFVMQVALSGQHDRDGLLPVGTRWGHRWRDTHYSLDDEVFAATEDALRRLAASEPEQARASIGDLRVAESDELRFLACRTLGVLGDPDDAIGWILSDERNLMLGWADNPRWASRDLLVECSPHCSDDLYRQAEAAILAYKPGYEGAVGYGQYTLLSGLDPLRLSGRGRRRLAELERRFESPPVAPRPVIASFVGPPIGDDAAKKMSDENWLSALQKHSSEKTDWSGDTPVGGATQLAQVLERRAKEEPDRFAMLALRFDGSIPATAGAHVLRGARSGIDGELLSELCVHLATLYGEDVGREICSAVEAVAAADDRLVDLVDRYSQSIDPDREWARTEAGTSGYYYGGDLFTAGLNCTRGGAALAAASLLYEGADHVDVLVPVVEWLAADANWGVRTCAAEAVIALLNHEPDVALSLAEALLEGPIDLMDARSTERLVTYCVLRSPERFSAQLARSLDGPDAVAERAGHIWAVADYRGVIAEPVAANVADLSSRARVGVAQVVAENVADSVELLAELFDDTEADVRAAASRALRSLEEVASDAVDSLIERFIRSRAFAECMDDLFCTFGKLGTRLPASAMEACERAVEVGGAELGDIRTSRAAMGRDLVAVVLRLYRQGDQDTRRRCLDIVDRLTEMNVHGIDEALSEER